MTELFGLGGGVAVAAEITGHGRIAVFGAGGGSDHALVAVDMLNNVEHTVVFF